VNRIETAEKTLASSERTQPRTTKSHAMRSGSKEQATSDFGVSSPHPTSVIGEDAPRSGRPRSALKICLDILQTIRDEGPSKPTRIILAANLSHDRLVRYLAELVSQGLLEENRETTARYYALTAKGLDFVNQVRETEALVAAFGLEM
jgi:predicted transcriptional regulator